MKVLNDEGLAHLWSKMKGTFVPNTLTINDKPLTSNIKITIEDLDIKIANSSTAGLVKSSEEENKIKVNEDGTMEVNTIASATKATQDGNGDVIADTYLKKVTTTASFNRAYAITAQGAPVMINVANGSADANSIAQRYSNGRLLVGTPESNSDATTKEYVDGLVIEVTNPYNENILINGEFNINQEGVTTYNVSSDKVKTVDMWIGWNGMGTFNANTKVLTNNLGNTSNATLILQQAIEDYNYLWGKTLTYTVKIDGVIYSTTGTLPTTAPTAKTLYFTKNITTESGYNCYIRLRYEPSPGMIYADIGLSPNSSSLTAVSSITLGFAKLEYGSVFTPIRRGGWNTNSTEILKCQRYYQRLYTHDVSSFATSTTSITVSFRLPVYLRVTPTLVKLTSGSPTTITGQGEQQTATKVTLSQMFSNIIRLAVTGTNLVVNQVYVLNSSDFALDANIY